MSKKQWPDNCIWPDPHYISWGEFDLADVGENECRMCWPLSEIIEAKEYFDSLEGESQDEDFSPEVGDEYWIDGKFDEEAWQDDFDQCMGKLKLYGCEAAYNIEDIIGYDFANENLLRQAFTRRAFALEYGLPSSSEELEFIGDTVLNYVLVRTMAEQYGKIKLDDMPAPFQCGFNEADMSKIKSKAVCKEHLSARAMELGLDKYILYGTADEETDSSREDMMEALIGAAAIDSNWDYSVLDEIVDRLLGIHLECPDALRGKDMYDVFNAWHQKHFTCMPEYEIHRAGEEYSCTIRFFVPENDKGIRRNQRIEVCGETRSKARAKAADLAHGFLDYHGLWMNLSEAKIDPDYEKSINQLQELFQKKYLNEIPQYTFKDDGEKWICTCICDAFIGEGTAKSKTEAKKAAAFKTLTGIYQSAGIYKDGWDKSYFMLVAEE